MQLGFNKLNLTLALIIFVIILGGGFYLYQNQKSQIQNDPQTVVSEEVKKIADEVGKLTELPKDEDPIIYTIGDVTKLSDRPFFKNAKNGDMVLIYPIAAKAILYDPLLKKVVDTALINMDAASAQQSEEVLPKVALRNGTETSGLTTKIETKLKQDGVKFETASKENAEKQDYQDSVIVVVNESSRDVAESIANILDATISDLPEGELEVEGADIVVILGKDAT